MAMNLRRATTVLAAVALIGGAPIAANAQGLPTAAQVALSVAAACPDSPALDQTICLPAVLAALGVADAHQAAGGVPPQVDIGYLLCQTAIKLPRLFQAIIDYVNASGNQNVKMACSSVLATYRLDPLGKPISPA